MKLGCRTDANLAMEREYIMVETLANQVHAAVGHCTDFGTVLLRQALLAHLAVVQSVNADLVTAPPKRRRGLYQQRAYAMSKAVEMARQLGLLSTHSGASG